MPKALSPVTLGHHGVINVDEEVPKTYFDTLGDEQKTDFKRLEEVGVVESARKPKPSAE